MKLHISILQNEPRLFLDRENIEFNEFKIDVFNYAKSSGINNLKLENVPHISKLFNLLDLYYNTKEERIYFILKVLVKCIGNKEVISSTRNIFSHGRMPGDLSKESRDNKIKNMREKCRKGMYNYFLSKNTDEMIYTESHTIASLYVSSQ
jgi:hypothetical protein